MANNIQFEIETLTTEWNRHNEIPMKVIVKNLSDKKIKIVAINPNITNHIELEEKEDTFEIGYKKEFDDICKELSFIIDNVLLFTNDGHRKILTDTVLKTYSEIFSKIHIIYKLLLFDRTKFKSIMNDFNKKLSKLTYRISNIEDAKFAYEKWIIPLEKNNPHKDLYEAKLIQLENIFSKLGKINSNYIAIVQPDSFYSKTYVLKFERRPISSKVYNVSFDSIFTEEEDPIEYRSNISTSIIISPKPLYVNILVGFFSILGTSLKYSMSNINQETTPSFFFNSLGNNILTSPGITSLIIAILIFNIVEFTDIGKKLKTESDWRTALTIGIISGIFGERLVEAIKVFLGLT